MWWWEEAGNEFKSWLESVFGPSSEKEQQQIADFQRMAAGPRNPNVKLPANTWDRRVQPVLDDHNKNNPVKASTPAPTASPKPTIDPNTPIGSQKAQEFIASQLGDWKAEFASTQRQSQGTINGVDPKANVWDPHSKKTQVGDPAEFAPKVTKVDTRVLEEIIREPYYWDDEKLKKVGTMMFHANLIGEGDVVNYDKVANAWAVLASTSARMLQIGKKVSPMDLLKRQSYGLGGDPRSPKTVTTTDTNYTVTNATTAKQLAQAALSTRIGRKATDAEVAEFITALRAEEKKNPTIQTATTTTNADGTSRTSTSTTRQGVDANAFADKYAMTYDTEEAKAYQAAGYYMPILFDAIKAPA